MIDAVVLCLLVMAGTAVGILSGRFIFAPLIFGKPRSIHFMLAFVFFLAVLLAAIVIGSK